MGYRDVSALATMRGIKAEGGWAVVCTEMVEIHYGADVAPYVELRIWDDQDIPALALIAEKIHAHGALAGIELCHSGYTAVNLYSREPPMAPTAMNASSYHFDPVQARAMDKEDIRNLRKAHRAAALRARRAGYDLIYVYAKPRPVIAGGHRRHQGCRRRPLRRPGPYCDERVSRAGRA